MLGPLQAPENHGYDSLPEENRAQEGPGRLLEQRDRPQSGSPGSAVEPDDSRVSSTHTAGSLGLRQPCLQRDTNCFVLAKLKGQPQHSPGVTETSPAKGSADLPGAKTLAGESTAVKTSGEKSAGIPLAKGLRG